jgi:uncharacterized protein YjbI with pentapeptide repeats
VHRGRIAAIVVILILATACGSGAEIKDEVGSCEIAPGVVCRNQDLRFVSLVAADLQGVDFTGSDLSEADLRSANLSGAKLVDTTLASTNLANASLKNADLTGAFMFGTNLTDADMSGANTTGVERCNVIEPDGALTEGFCAGATGDLAGDEPAPVEGPPTIEYFRLVQPERCLVDAAGDGVEVEWSMRNVAAVNFSVDGIRIESANKRRGTKRLPFECDGRDHIVSVQAFGANNQSVSDEFTASLQPSAPISAND